MRSIRGAALIPVLVIISILALRFSPYPELRDFLARKYSVRYYDRHGLVLQIPPVDSEGLRREWTYLSRMPPELPAAFIAAEDRRFFLHPGVDFIAIIRAASQNLQEHSQISGASTITMQLSRIISRAQRKKNAKTSQKRGIIEKITETVNALRLESRLSKPQILELYLNNVPFGSQSEGVTTAARTFFAADLSALTDEQIKTLSVIPRRPARYQNLARPYPYPFEAPHYVRYLAGNGKWEVGSGKWVSASNTYQTTEKSPDNPIKSRLANPLPISHSQFYTTLSLPLQRRLEDQLAAAVERYQASRLSNAAAIVIENETGFPLAWVGSAAWENAKAAGQVDGVLARNQMGSSMKPFLYALALEKGIQPATVLADIPSVFGEQTLYIPQNFNNRFNGPTLMRRALASSLNIPAVTLLYRLGVENYAAFLRSLGFTSIDALDANGDPAWQTAGLGLALGNTPVSLLELASAFSVFPAAGKTNSPSPISPDTARIICDFLSDKRARALGFGSAPVFETPFPAMFKTGTANQYQSIVALGATGKYTAAVWMGNFTGETVVGKTGSGLPASIVRDTLLYLEGGSRSEQVNKLTPLPDRYTLIDVCSLSGMRPGPACLSRTEEFFPKDALPSVPCTWHRLEGGRVLTVYPAEYQTWLASSGRAGEAENFSLEIVSPRDGWLFYAASGENGKEAVIPVELRAIPSIVVEAFLDGQPLPAKEREFTFEAGRGQHTLLVRQGGEERRVSFSVE